MCVFPSLAQVCSLGRPARRAVSGMAHVASGSSAGSRDAGDGPVPGGSDSLALGSGDGLEPGGDGLGPGGGLGPDHPARAPWPSGYQRLSETPVGQGVVSRVFGAIREYTGEVVAVKVHPVLPNSSALREVMAFRQLQAVPSPHCLSMLGQIVAGPALFTVHPLFSCDLLAIVKGPRVQAGLAKRGLLDIPVSRRLHRGGPLALPRGRARQPVA